MHLQDNGPLRCPCNDATILFLKPVPDAKLAQRLALLKAKFALPGDREIAASFYFDLTLRAMLAVRLVFSCRFCQQFYLQFSIIKKLVLESVS